MRALRTKYPLPFAGFGIITKIQDVLTNYNIIIRAVEEKNEVRKNFVLNNKNPSDDCVKKRERINQTKKKKLG